MQPYWWWQDPTALRAGVISSFTSPPTDTLSLSALTVGKHNAVLPLGGQTGGYLLPFPSCGM